MGKDTKSYGAGFALGGMITQGSFWARLVGYFILYVVLVFFMVLWGSKDNFNGIANTIGVYRPIVFITIVYFSPAFLLFLWERSTRKWRRANGFSVYGDISAELKQRELTDKVKKEHKAFVDAGVVKESGVDKNDVGYWFGLFEKGAITKEQYESKRDEILGK